MNPNSSDTIKTPEENTPIAPEQEKIPVQTDKKETSPRSKIPFILGGLLLFILLSVGASFVFFSKPKANSTSAQNSVQKNVPISSQPQPTEIITQALPTITPLVMTATPLPTIRVTSTPTSTPIPAQTSQTKKLYYGFTGSTFQDLDCGTTKNPSEPIVPNVTIDVYSAVPEKLMGYVYSDSNGHYTYTYDATVDSSFVPPLIYVKPEIPSGYVANPKFKGYSISDQTGIFQLDLPLVPQSNQSNC